MKITNEKKVECWDLDVDLSEKEIEELSCLGLDLIKDDKEALVGYVFNRLLTKFADEFNQKEKYNDNDL